MGRKNPMWRPFPALGLALGCALALAVTGCESDPLFPDLTDVRWIDVTAGGFHSCGVSSDGMGFCWGSNSSGQLGTAASVDEAASPVDVSGGATLLQIDAGAAHTCAVSSQGGVLCWGDNQFGQVGDGTVLEGTSSSPLKCCPRGRSFRFLPVVDIPVRSMRRAGRRVGEEIIAGNSDAPTAKPILFLGPWKPTVGS